MKIKDILAIMTVALTAGGCSQQDDGAQQDERVPILLKASVDGVTVGQTRAAGDWGERTTTMTQGSEFLAGEQVIAYIKENDGSNTAPIQWPIEYVVMNNNGDLDPASATPPFYYPTGVNTINIHAIHPSYTSGAGFTVETDQTTESNYAISDLCYSKPTDYTRSGATAYLDANGRRILQFKHLLSKVIVNLTVDASAATGTPSYIMLHAKTTTAMSFPVDNANGYTGCTASDASNPGAIKMIQEAIIPPQEIAAGALFISFTVPGIGPMMYPMPTATTFESGKKYTYNLKVTDVGITVTTNVSDWGTKVANQQVMGKMENYKKNPLWYVSEYNLSSDGVNFDKRESTSQGYLFQWSGAMALGYSYNTSGYDGYALPSMPKGVNNGESGATWHIPTIMEIRSILPGEGDNDYNFFRSTPTANTVFTENPCTFGYNNDTKYGVGNTSNPATPTGTQFKSYWSTYTSGNLLRYAIRFLGTAYCSVWKYQILNNNTTSSRLVITSRLISPIGDDDLAALSSKLTEIMGSSYDWTASDCIVRTFYLTGFGGSAAQASPGNNCANIEGEIWSATPQSSTVSYFMRYARVSNADYLYLHRDGITRGFGVRLFRDN